MMAARNDLPGEDLVHQGLRDLAAGIESVPALVVVIGAPRLRRLGVPLPPADDLPAHPELCLYRALCRSAGSGAHSRYNAVIRRLVSFERALEFRQAREARLRRASARRPS